MREQVERLCLRRFTPILALGGKEYRRILAAVFSSAEVCFPFASLPIGKMMQAVRKEIEFGKTQT